MTAAQNDDVISPQQAVTLHGLFLERVRRSQDKIAYKFFDVRQSVWVDLSWGQMLEQVARWQAALAREGLVKGDRVAIMLRNCPQWVMFDQAAMSLGLITVPLYTVDRADNIAYIVNDAQVKVLLFETEAQWQELSGVVGQMGCVQRFVSLDDFRNDEPRLVPAAKYLLTQLAELQAPVPCDCKELASIIYTSGTTGRPKGVMLSHNNMLSNTYDAMATFMVRGDDLLLSFLPLSHTFERTCGYYLQVMTAATVAYARSIPLLSEDLKTIKPTILISVPRIYERIYGAISTKLAEGPAFKRMLFHLAVEVGWARFLHQQRRGGWKPSFLLWPLLDKLVAQKILERLGGRLRTTVSGGAALAPEISRVFVGLGLPVVQGYGLTETSPIVSGNKLDNNFPDSVGQPIRGVQVKLGEQHALLVKGPNVMMGYWNNPEATRAMIDADGWLNTGDIAHISETGHIYITGRLKEIIVLSNGEKMPPADMEAAILHDPLIDQVMIYGEGRPYLIALAVLNPEVWLQVAAKVGVRPDMPESLTDSAVEAKVLRRIARNLSGFPGYAKVHRVLLLREPWTIDNGLLTPKLSLKRNHVVAAFSRQIDELYKGH
ncbi:AMP-dependent synthetase/ligase [Sideroxydans lithotrophicus]|uniref:AMP-dependent synthetase and ligase n=1 Tax=Sideroxydans lithotrophicus (strain ES-1) TaxID=580332 RepID=D5CT02_SIDLE|nr:long-chain fatty acid--CoA ligase [Sideroxydans lithotrophicus]ADE12088.1 AMP-dependent synthetase and ligase [Sideroxydans lithotrophicus ES-1]